MTNDVLFHAIRMIVLAEMNQENCSICDNITNKLKKQK